jgi:hypothetical protein
MKVGGRRTIWRNIVSTYVIITMYSPVPLLHANKETLLLLTNQQVQIPKNFPEARITTPKVSRENNCFL